MKLSRRLSLALKALRQLGLRQAGLFALYRLGLWKALTADRRPPTDSGQPSAVGGLFTLPEPAVLAAVLGPNGCAALLAEADEIVGGKARLFGGEPIVIDLDPGLCEHWTAYEKGEIEIPSRQPSTLDVKKLWEPARFGWAFTLGRAYRLNGDERYPEAFWRFVELFWEANPPNRGPNWASAQEVALRLMAFTFAAQVFANSSHSSAARTARLAQSIAEHAVRIPPTMIYARAQNNNHLLSEAAGLITAGLALPKHPQATRWLALGCQWFEHGLRTQIAADGAYCQHSTNYHRLMLQLALWVSMLNVQRLTFNVQQSVRWLLALCDAESGRAPNLGPNDGAYIFPFTVCPFDDYRPVLQAASQAFLGQPAFGAGVWDEMALWFNVERSTLNVHQTAIPSTTMHAPHGWAYLRAARFTSRPGHADQLHLDLWQRGLNVAQDAGTYQYNAPPPWDNALASAFVHNTVTVNGQEPMTRAGRFLYLDWAQGKIVSREQAADGAWERLTAQHDGYKRLGVLHRRSAAAYRDGRWVVEDELLPGGRVAYSVLRKTYSVFRKTLSLRNTQYAIRLHWLLPDWPFEIRNSKFEIPNSNFEIALLSPHGWISLRIHAVAYHPLPTPHFQLIRAGQLLHGSAAPSPVQGWVSPTYGVRLPALSLAITVAAEIPVCLTSEFIFPE